MKNQKGKLDLSQKTLDRILNLTRNKDHCININQFDYVLYMQNDSDGQLWAMVQFQTHLIRNCGINREEYEYRIWHPNNGFALPQMDQFNWTQNYKLTMFQIFNVMRMYMMVYFEKTKDDDIGLLLSGLMLSPDQPDWKKNPRTWDPAAWDDWMDGVNKTLKDLGIKQDPKKNLYDEQMAFLCMKNYLQLFYNQISFDGVKNILMIINNVKIGSKNDQEWNYFLQCIQAAIDQEPNIVA